jgi:hypothetical protein
MKVSLVVVAGLSCVLVTSERVGADAGGRGASEYSCDTCDALCPLVDVYLQKEAGINLWKRWASSTPEAQRSQLPGDFATAFNGSIEDYFGDELTDFTLVRALPCHLPPEALKTDPNQKDPPSTLAETVTTNTPDRCQIKFRGNNVADPTTRQALRDAWKCDLVVDALLAHEGVHQQKCLDVYKNPAEAPKYFSNPAEVAQNELEAWTKERDMIADRIRSILKSNDCGWIKTDGQKAQGDKALPSQVQVLQMQERGWGAVDALGGTRK